MSHDNDAITREKLQRLLRKIDEEAGSLRRALCRLGNEFSFAAMALNEFQAAYAQAAREAGDQ